MHIFKLVALLPLAAAFPAPDGSSVKLTPALEAPGYLDTATLKFIGDGKGEARAPCPFLNACANYGILPYSGKEIHPEHIQKLILKMSMPTATANFLAKAVARAAGNGRKADPNHSLEYMNLDDLRWHDIEHDGSISRWDVDLPTQKPNDQFADPALVEKLIKFSREYAKKNGQEDADTLSDDDFKITGAMIGAWHHERIRLEAERGHRTPDTSFKTTVTAAGEATMVVNIIGHDDQISAADARNFFVGGKFPKGWKIPEAGISNLKIMARMAVMASAYEISPSWSNWFNTKWQSLKAGVTGDWGLFHLGGGA